MNRRIAKYAIPAFISTQVTEARRFFFSLKPSTAASLEVVCGGVERMRSTYTIDRDDFPYYGIEVVAEGQGTFKVHENVHQLSPGAVFSYGPGIRHAIRNHSDDGEMRKYYIDFVGRQAPSLLKDAGLMDNQGRYKLVRLGSVYEITEIFEMLFRNSNEDGPSVLPICGTLLRLILQKIAQLRLSDGNSVPRSYETYERIRRHIDDRCLAVQTIQEVAEECGVTPVYLSRLFKRFSDCGAYQYLLRRKMNYAAGLIMNDGLMVKEVAKRLGMPDAFQFSRAFKRVFGVPPSQLDRTHAK